MDCKVIQAELVTYHFGMVDEPLRDQVEQHLLGCAACLSAFLRLKRAVETAPHAGAGPSDAARTRLRQAAEPELARLAADAGRRPGSFWRARSARVALAVVGAMTAVLVLLRMVGPGAPARG